MTDANFGSRDEVERIRRVSDQLCTGHASLRDRYERRALILDISILLLSAWLSAIAFADPRFDVWLVPWSIDPGLWLGLLGTFTFGLSLFQLKAGWKSRAEAHKRSFGMYAEVKREAGYMLASTKKIEPREFQRLAARYDMASDVGIGVPESEFLPLKRRHLIKIEISKKLDKKPGMSIFLTKLKMIFWDNWPWRKD